MLYLNADEIVKALTLHEVMACVEEALHIYEAGDFVMPERLTVPAGEAEKLLLMPCAAEGHMVTKLVSVYPGNRARGRPAIDGLVVLYDRATAEILSLMDGKAITALRTGAVTGVSVAHLAREDVRTVGLVGCGVQGYYQVLYAAAVRNIHSVSLYDVDSAASAALEKQLRPTLPGVEITVADSPEALARGSDILITATTARKPVFPDDPDLFADKHCVAIGSFEPDVREYPDALFSLVEKVWVDIDFAKEESGELMIPMEKGLLEEDRIETLGHLIESGAPPARGPSGTTFSKSVGMALFDLTTARQAYANARDQGLGTELGSEAEALHPLRHAVPTEG
jgi:ornithine cyclodeaminase/alanine dehydrogenase-like protein (mu-crystallin family)